MSLSQNLHEARDPACKPERLRALASQGDQEVRRAVAGNPNTPEDVLYRLAVRFPREFLENPVLDLLLLVNPNFLAEMPEYARRRILAQPRVEVGYLRWVLKHGDTKALLSLAQNPATPPETLEPLLAHPVPAVAEAARLHVSLEASPLESAWWWLEGDSEAVELRQLAVSGLIPNWLTPRLARESDPALRAILAASEATTPEVLEALLFDEDEDVRRAARANPAMPKESLELLSRLEAGLPGEARLELLAHGHVWMRSLVARYAHTPQALLEGFSADEDWRVRQAVASNPNLGVEWLAVLASDSDRDVRQAVAANLATPPEVLERLVGDENEEVRTLAAANPNVPAGVLELLARAEAQDAALPPQELGRMASFSEWARRIAASHPNAPQETLERCQADSDWHTRLAVARNPKASPEILSALATDSDPDVRQAVARHPNTPQDFLERLSSDDQPDVRAQVLQNPALPPFLIAKLAADDHWKVRQAVAASPLTPPEWLTHLAQDSDRDVRQAVADNPQVPEEALEPLFSGWFAGLGAEMSLLELYRQAKNLAPELSPLLLGKLAEGNEWARRLAARHPATQAPDLARLARDEDWRVRLAVAENPQAQGALLEALAQDTDADVRKAVARHPGLGGQGLKMLAKDENLEVRLLVAAHPQTPAQTLYVLAGDDDESVRQAARGNPATSSECLERYGLAEALNPQLSPGFLEALAQRGLYARALAAQNPALPTPRLRLLVQDSEWKVRQAAALNPALDGESLGRLAHDSDRDVRLAVAVHGQTPREALAQLLSDADENVRRTALGHSNLDAQTLTEYKQRLLVAASRSRYVLNRAVALAHPDLPAVELAKVRHRASPDWLVRYALAQNPSTAAEALAELAQDGNRRVRIEATLRRKEES